MDWALIAPTVLKDNATQLKDAIFDFRTPGVGKMPTGGCRRRRTPFPPPPITEQNTPRRNCDLAPAKTHEVERDREHACAGTLYTLAGEIMMHRVV
ncbi:unnamed protein product, partial [Iphiclides podalirius]